MPALVVDGLGMHLGLLSSLTQLLEQLCVVGMHALPARHRLLPRLRHARLLIRELHLHRAHELLALPPQALTFRLHLVERALFLDERRLRLEHALPQVRIHLVAQRRERVGAALHFGRERAQLAALCLDLGVRVELCPVQRRRVDELLLELALARRHRRALQLTLPLQLGGMHALRGRELHLMLSLEGRDPLVARLARVRDLLLGHPLRRADRVDLSLLARFETCLEERLGIGHLVALALLFEREQLGELLLALR